MINSCFKTNRLLFGILAVLFSLNACSQIKDENMKWTAKFDFFDLYKRRLGQGQFNPGGSLRIETIVVPNENTIILGGSKYQSEFDNNPFSSNVAVLFVSQDKGQHYQEILIGEEKLEYLESNGNYTIVKAYTMRNGKKEYKIFLLDNSSFELIKADEFIAPKDFLDYSYSYFDGKYSLLNNFGKTVLVNLLDSTEVYEIPKDIVGDYFFNTGNGNIAYQKGFEIRSYNVMTKEDTVLNVLKNKYDYFFYINNQLVLMNVKKKNGIESQADVYDIYENFLYDETKETENFYRYKNFVCDYRRLGVKPQIRYSYDNGKTWKTHYVNGFTIQTNRVGFYKDQFMVVEGIFWHGDSPESGGRIMVGEFEK